VSAVQQHSARQSDVLFAEICTLAQRFWHSACAQSVFPAEICRRHIQATVRTHLARGEMRAALVTLACAARLELAVEADVLERCAIAASASGSVTLRGLYWAVHRHLHVRM
jgi:hypothetical protein